MRGCDTSDTDSLRVYNQSEILQKLKICNKTTYSIDSPAFPSKKNEQTKQYNSSNNQQNDPNQSLKLKGEL